MLGRLLPSIHTYLLSPACLSSVFIFPKIFHSFSQLFREGAGNGVVVPLICREEPNYVYGKLLPAMFLAAERCVSP